MKKKLFYIIYSIFVVALLISSAETTAFFTAKFGPLTNLFTAGTVMINSGDASGELVVKDGLATWAPGECKEVELTITNTGSKKAYVRARFEGAWQAAFHRNIASVNAEYSYTVGETEYTGTVLSSSDPVYYFYGDHAEAFAPECSSTSTSWFTAKNTVQPLNLEPIYNEASLESLDTQTLDYESPLAEDSSFEPEIETQSEDGDETAVFIDSFSEPVQIFLDDGDNNLFELDEASELGSLDGGSEIYSSDEIIMASVVGPPTVNGRFYGDDDYLRYNLAATTATGSKLYTYVYGRILYVALVVDRSVNDNVFDKTGTPYLASAGWPGQGRHFGSLSDSEFAGFKLSCGDIIRTWKQGYIDQLGVGGAGPNRQFDHTKDTFYSDENAKAGGGTPPDCGPGGFQSSSSLVWNMNNYASLDTPSWDVTLKDVTPLDERTTSQTWKSPFVPGFPDDVTNVDGYPETGQITFSEVYGWEWPMVYEFSVDLSCCGNDPIFLENISSHHSPSKIGGNFEDDDFPEDPVPIPGIAIQKCVSVDGKPANDPEKVWFCNEPWPTLTEVLPEGFAPDFKFVVTNTGGIPLTDIEVTDDVFGVVDTISSLALEESQNVYFTDTAWKTRMALDAENVSIELCDVEDPKVGYDPDDWYVDLDGYFYYTKPLPPEDEVTLCVKVCMDEDPEGIYEGAEFILYTCVDAIQASHEAVFSEWGVGLVDGAWVEVIYNNINDRWETENGSHYWDGTTWVG